MPPPSCVRWGTEARRLHLPLMSSACSRLISPASSPRSASNALAFDVDDHVGHGLFFHRETLLDGIPLWLPPLYFLAARASPRLELIRAGRSPARGSLFANATLAELRPTNLSAA